MNKSKKVMSFFAGVGGIDLGFERAGGFEVIYANEFDDNARKTYEANFDLKVDPRDIRHVQPEEIPDADILLAGFPCQPFSVAGYRKGFEDERGDLFFETLRIILQKKPEVVFLENVKNMVTHDHGNTFKVIREGLVLNGYFLKWAVLNAKEYGNVPQNRERIYIVGFRSKQAYDNFKFPDSIPLTNPLNKFIDFKSKVDDIYYYSKEKNPTFYDKLEEAITTQDTVYQWRRQYVRENKSGVVPTLTANMGTGGHNVPLILSDFGIRKLTPRETFNVQGFPMDFIFPKDVSNGQLYKQAGNSVVVSVIKRIAENIKLALHTSDNLSANESSEGRYAVTYTKMFGSNFGESYVLGKYETFEELEKTMDFKMLQVIRDEEYFSLIRKKREHEFYMINDLETNTLAYA